MPNYYMRFKMPEQREEFENAHNGSKYRAQVDDIWDKVFRPFYKHGYGDSEFDKLLDKNHEVASEIFEKLSDIYHKILREEI